MSRIGDNQTPNRNYNKNDMENKCKKREDEDISTLMKAISSSYTYHKFSLTYKDKSIENEYS